MNSFTETDIFDEDNNYNNFDFNNIKALFRALGTISK